MKKIILSFVFIFVLYTSVIFAGTVKYTDNVTTVKVVNWGTDTTCICVGGKWFKLDMSTEKGKASYALALTAYTAGKKVQVRWLADSALVGGCDTGTTMYPLYSVQFAE